MANSTKMWTLNSGVQVPMVGLGTWKSNPGEVAEAVKSAIDAGYRNIDAAWIYGNEKEVGDGLKAKFDDKTITREDVFITTKLWNTFHREDLVDKTLRDSLNNLRLEYVDLYLMHWPMAYKEDGDKFPKDENGKFIYSDVDYMETWKAMEKCVEKGLTKHIGLSNCNSQQLQRVIDEGTIKPAMLQIEINPYVANEKLVEFCLERGVAVTGYSPLGSPDRPWAKPEDPTLLEEPAILEIAKRVNKTVAQVVLRWQIQRNIIVIPKSVTPARIKANAELFDFELTEEDMKTIYGFKCNFRVCSLDWVKDHKYWPFNIPF